MVQRKLYGARIDPRFAPHQRQPRANKLDARQRAICLADGAYSDALAKRVTDPARFSAFLAAIPFFINLDGPCPKCGGYRRRTRDRSCYACHLNRGGDNFERIKAGVSPIKSRSLDSHLDLLERQRAERRGEHIAATFGSLSAKRYPLGRLEVTFPDGFVEPDLNKTDPQHVERLSELLPELRDVLVWAGWF